MSGEQKTGDNKDLFTAADGMQLYNLIKKLADKLNFDSEAVQDKLKEISNRVANIQRSEIDILETLNLIEANLSQNRVVRLENELREAEIEREIAQKRLEALDERVEIKKAAKDHTSDTAERIKEGANLALADLERKRKEASSAYWLDVRRSAVKAIIVASSVSGFAGIVAFIWWLIMLYINQGGRP